MKEKLKQKNKAKVIFKKADLSDIFGSAKIKETGQQLKDMVRKWWN